MAFFYQGGDRDQLFLMPVSMREWLDEGHLVWFVIDVVATIDTTGFHARHPNDGVGRPAFNPEMMLSLLLYAYSTGMRSSRRIEAACRTDAAFRVICAGVTPDHATIARFLVDHQTAIEDCFVNVLRLCAAAGLVSIGMIAIDGTKISADAALDKNRAAAWIRGEIDRILGEATTTDSAEDKDNRLAGVVPVELSTHTGRLARLNDALAQINAHDDAARHDAEEHAATALAAAVEGRKLPGRKPKDPHAALARAAADHTAALARAATKSAQRAAKEQVALARGRRLGGFPPRPDQRVERTAAALATAHATANAAVSTATKANITDPDSRIMKNPTGWVQGYNAQAAVNEHQIVIACAVTQDANDLHQYQPMVAATQHALAAAGITEPIGLILADAGYWSDDNATADGPERLIATLKDWKQRRAARDLGTTTGPPPDNASTTDTMEHRLRTIEGATAYAHRSHTVEPVFADHKENHGWRRFRRRGLDAVRSEWALMNICHNLAKLFTHHTESPRPAPA